MDLQVPEPKLPMLRTAPSAGKQPPDWNLPDEAPEMPDVPLLPPTHTGRIKSVAGVQDVDPVHILNKVSGRLPSATEAFVADVAIYYRVAQGTQAPGKVSNHKHTKPLEIGSLLSFFYDIRLEPSGELNRH